MWQTPKKQETTCSPVEIQTAVYLKGLTVNLKVYKESLLYIVAEIDKKLSLMYSRTHW